MQQKSCHSSSPCAATLISDALATATLLDLLTLQRYSIDEQLALKILKKKKKEKSVCWTKRPYPTAKSAVFAPANDATEDKKSNRRTNEDHQPM